MQRMVLALIVAAFPAAIAAADDVVVEHARTFRAVAEYVVQLEGRNAELETRVDKLESENAALQARVAELEGLLEPGPETRSAKHLLVFNDTLVPAVRDEAVAAGAEICQIYYHWHVDPEKDGTVDLERFGKFLDQMDRDIKWGCIDLEKPYSAWLMGNDNLLRQKAINEMREALTLAEKKRPDVAWSFWGIPKLKRIRMVDGVHAPWSVTPDWWKTFETGRIDLCADLYADMEWFCPDLYWGRVSGAATEDEADASHRAWAAVMLDKTESVAGEKPIIPAVWHRYYNAAGMTSRNLLMTSEQWQEHLTLSLRDGVVWWAAESDQPQMEQTHRLRIGEAIKTVLHE